MALVELLDGEMKRRSVHDRVVRSGRDAEHVRVLVAERTRQVRVHLVEAEHERLRPPAGSHRRSRDRRCVVGGEALQRAGGARRR